MAPPAGRGRSTLTRIALVVLTGALLAVTPPGARAASPVDPGTGSHPAPSAMPHVAVDPSDGSAAVVLNQSTLVLFNNTLVPGYYVSTDSSLPSLEAYDAANNEVFVEGFYSGVIDVVSAATNAVVNTISTGPYPNTLAFDAHTGNLFYGLQTDDLVGTVNASTDLIQRTVDIGFEPLAMAADPVSGNVFVTGWNSTGDYVAVVSGASGVVNATFSFANTSWFPVAGPNGLAYDTVTGTFYVASYPSGVPQYQAGNLTLINASTDSVRSNVSLPFAPGSVLYAPSNGDLYLGNASGNDLSVFNPTSGKLVKKVALPDTPTMLTYGTNPDRVYVGIDGNVSVVSTRSNKVTSTFPVTRQPDGLAFDPHNGFLYIADYVWNNVSFVNVTSFAVGGSILLGALPYNMAFDTANGDLYIGDLESSQLIVVNGTTNRVVGYVPLGGTPYGIVYDPETRDVYVDNFYASNVSVVSGVTNTLTGYLPSGTNPWGIAYDGANHDLYVTNVGSNNITILDPQKGTVVQSLNFTTPPGAIAYDARAKTIFVGEYNVGNVSVLNATSNRRIRNTTTGSEPYTISVDPKTGDAFVGNYASDNVTVLGSRGKELGLSVAVGVGVFGSAYSPFDGNVYVASFDSDLVSVINGSTETDVGGYSVGTGPVAVAVDPTTGTVYVANYDSGSLTLLTPPVKLFDYNVTFTESGLPHGRRWSVAFDGARESTTGRTLTFAVANGTYPYLVTGPSGYPLSGFAPEGNLTVGGSSLVEAVAFVRGATYSLTFTETGLPAGTRWCVSIASTVCSTTDGLVFRNLSNGTYTYAVVPVRNYTAEPASGAVKVTGAAKKVKISF